jgi:general stress protein CsbA
MGCSGEIMTAIFIVRVVADSVGEYAKWVTSVLFVLSITARNTRSYFWSKQRVFVASILSNTF